MNKVIEKSKTAKLFALIIKVTCLN